MKGIFFITILLCVYIWAVSSGHEQFFLDQSKKLYDTIVEWFDDSKVDYQIGTAHTPPPPADSPVKKRTHRWD
jgi:hypothetical protein